VTASFGVAPLPDANLTSEQWMALADEALYRAKRTGRNRCCITTSTS
jgi:diguanylate cyclase (GGDEF)-like protein